MSHAGISLHVTPFIWVASHVNTVDYSQTVTRDARVFGPQAVLLKMYPLGVLSPAHSPTILHTSTHMNSKQSQKQCCG